MILNYIIVIGGYISVMGLLGYILAMINIKYIDLKIKKDLTRIFIKLELLILATSILVGYLGLLLKLLKMI